MSLSDKQITYLRGDDELPYYEPRDVKQAVKELEEGLTCFSCGSVTLDCDCGDTEYCISWKYIKEIFGDKLT